MSGARDWSRFQRPWPLQIRTGPLWIVGFVGGPALLQIGLALVATDAGILPWMDALAFVGAIGTTVGIYMATVSSPGLDTPGLRMLAHMTRRFAVFWLAAAGIAALKEFPLVETYGEAGFIGRALGRALVFTLGLVYLRFFFLAWSRPRAALAATALAFLYGASHVLEVLLITQPLTSALSDALFFSFVVDVAVGASALGMLVHARSVFLAEHVDEDPAP
jgi:hypothetical protein